METLNYRKVLILSLLGLLVVALIIWCGLWLLTSKIVISTDPAATIFVRQAESDFEEIGKGLGTYKTRSKSPVFVESRLNEKSTQKSIEPVRRKETHVSLELKETAAADYFADGPIIYPHIDGKFMYGINPNTNSLTVKPLRNVKARAPRVPLLPFLKQIIWFDTKNFLYITLGRGAGIAGAGPADDHSEINFIDAANIGNNLLLVAEDGVYLGKNRSIDRVKKVSALTANASHNVFATPDHFYYTSLLYEDIADESDEPVGKQTIVAVFDINGKKTVEHRLAIGDLIKNVVEIDQQVFVLLSESGLCFVDSATNTSQTKSFSLGKVEDLVTYNGRLLLLGEGGLWEYDRLGDAYYRLASYPQDEGYTPKSLVVLGKSLYFSTTTSRTTAQGKSSAASSRVYEVKLP